MLALTAWTIHKPCTSRIARRCVDLTVIEDLDRSHPYRRIRRNFRSGVVEKRDPPIIRTGHELLDELDQFEFLRVNEEDGPEHNTKVGKFSAG